MAVRKRSWRTASGEEKQAWVVDYFDQAGKRHIKTFAKKKDADAALAETKVEVRRGTHTADSSSITIEKAAELWLGSCHSNRLERSTTAAYQQHVELHINPHIGRLKLSQLSAPMVREFEDKLRKGEPASGEAVGKARSSALTKKIIGSLGAILSDAQERGLVARNVVRELRSSRRRGKERRAERRQRGKLKIGVDIPTRQEIKAIIEAVEGRARPLLLMAVFTGLRASELRGLRWEDIDLKKGELHVRQRADRYNAIGKPKSEAGERTVPMPPMLLSAMKEWRLACPKSDRGLVFPTSTGAVEHHSNMVKRVLGPAQIRAGVVERVRDAEGKPAIDADGKPLVRPKYPGLHALRHFYASWCINRIQDGGLGLPPKVVQERLGHSSISMTLDVYGHLFPRGDDGAEMAAAERALLG